MKLIYSFIIKSLLLLSFALLTTGAYSTSYTWNSSSGNWNDPSKWSPNGVPGLADSVTLNNGGTLYVSNNITTQYVKLSQGFLNMAAGTTLTITGIFNFVTGFILGTGTVDVTGTFYCGGPYDSYRQLTNTLLILNGGGYVYGGNWPFYISTNGTVELPAGETLTFHGGSNAHFEDNSGGTGHLYFYGNVIFSASNSHTDVPSSFSNNTVTFTSGYDLSNASFTMSDVIIENNATLNFRKGNSSFISTSISTPGNGKIELASPPAGQQGPVVTIDGSSSLNTTLYLGGLSTLYLEPDATIPYLRLQGGTLAGVGDLTVSGDFHFWHGTLAGSGILDVNGITGISLGGQTPSEIRGSRTVNFHQACVIDNAGGNLDFYDQAVLNIPATSSLEVYQPVTIRDFSNGNAMINFESILYNVDQSLIIEPPFHATNAQFEIYGNSITLTSFLGGGVWDNVIINAYFEDSDDQLVLGDGLFEITGNVSINEYVDLLHQATMQVNENVTFSASNFTNQGILKGNGSITVNGSILHSEPASIEPGLSPGILTLGIDGNLGGSTLSMELADASGPGTGHDKLIVPGNLFLNGAHLVVLSTGCIPNGVYDIITYGGSRTGEFATTTLPPGMSLSYDDSQKKIIVQVNITEICNGMDDDCDGEIDEGVGTYFYADADEDGFGDSQTFVFECAPPPGYVTDDGDCDDSNPDIHPGGQEICNGMDDDCDGLTDDADPGITGQTIWYQDLDQDGFGDALVYWPSCSSPAGFVSNDEDCDDSNPNIHPDASETCNGLDDDCDGLTDDEDPSVTGLTTWYQDDDADGFGDPSSLIQACLMPPGYSANADDCDDTDPLVFPGGPEFCNGYDDNCDGQVDEGVLITFYYDADGDGYGDFTQSTTACSAPAGYVDNGSDCDDTNESIYPGAPELCNGLDDDCDGLTDDDIADMDLDGICDTSDNCPESYNPDQADYDNDGSGDVCDANDDNDPAADINDCAPLDPSTYPGAPELCGDDVDNDCDGKVDEPLLIVVLQEQDVLCYGSATGLISVTGDCGLAPYTYQWNNGSQSATIQNLLPGTYKVTVTDAQGLIKKQTFYITQPSALNASTSKTNVSCHGGSDGAASANGNGGTAPYTYQWSTGASTQYIYGLTAGSYMVTVTDNNGCTKIKTVHVTEPSILQITNTIVSDDPDYPGQYTITVTASGGTPYANGYRYRRCESNGSGCGAWQVSPVLTDLDEGYHLVKVKDANGCTDEMLVYIENMMELRRMQHDIELDQDLLRSALSSFMQDDTLWTPKPLLIIESTYPNPGFDRVFIQVTSTEKTESRIYITGLDGKLRKTYNHLLERGQNLLELNLPALETGLYLIRMESGSFSTAVPWIRL